MTLCSEAPACPPGPRALRCLTLSVSCPLHPFPFSEVHFLLGTILLPRTSMLGRHPTIELPYPGPSTEDGAQLLSVRLPRIVML